MFNSGKKLHYKIMNMKAPLRIIGMRYYHRPGKAGTEAAAASAGDGPATGKQATAIYRKGMAVFVYTKGGLILYEAAIGGQKFKFKPNEAKK